MQTHIIVVLDRSGSMSSIKAAAIEGFNTFIREQREFSPDAVVTLVQFNHAVEVTFHNRPLNEVPPLSSLNYRPDGYTALRDGVGHAIDVVGMPSHNAGAKVVVCVLTDGAENQSRKYTDALLKQRVDWATEAGWTFIYLAANVDARETGARYGFDASTTYAFNATAAGATQAYADMSRATRAARMCP